MLFVAASHLEAVSSRIVLGLLQTWSSGPEMYNRSRQGAFEYTVD